MEDRKRTEFFRETFDAVSGGYDNTAMAYFSESAAALAADMELGGEERVLDVATGTGNVALAIAGRLPRGRVTAIDISPGMLRRAAAKRDAREIGNIDFREMDMQSITLPDRHFDAAVTAFGIFFAADMEAQLRHISGKVRPGGGLFMTTFTEGSFSPLVDLLLRGLRDRGAEIPPMAWKDVATEQSCLALYGRAGLGKVRSRSRDFSARLKDPDQWWEIVWNAGYRGLVNRLPAAERELFRRDHLREVKERFPGGKIPLPVGVLFTAGVVSSAGGSSS